MVGGVRSFTDDDLASDVEEFFRDHPIPQGKLMLEQHLELMRVNVALREREADRLSAFLRGA